MSCQISREQLWSWVDRDAPELAEHIKACPSCRARAEEIRSEIGLIASDTMTLRIPLPDRIGSYAIKGLIGEGGQALVYEAEQDSPRRRVALKVLKGGRFFGQRELRRFRREIQAMASLRHPSIASIYEAGQTEDGAPYFAMELVRGTPLHLFVQEAGITLRDRLDLFCRVCDAVHYAHRHGVLHRDLKPANILIDEERMPRILDFGLARLNRSEFIATLTESGLVEGTPRYMSPERICGRTDSLDARSDVYALGVILYEMLTGRPPFDVVSFTPEAVRTICEGTPPRPGQLDPRLRGDLEAVLLRALEKEPERRYPSAEALAGDIRRVAAGEPVHVRRPAVFKTARRAVNRHPLGAVAGGAALLVLALAVRSLTQAPFDRLEARRTALNLHYRLLMNPPDMVHANDAFQAPDRYPGLLDAILLCAQAHACTKEYRFAVDILAEELSRNPSARPVRDLLAEVYTAIGRNAEAANLAGASSDKAPETAEAWYMRALATLDLERGLTCAREALRRQPDHQLALEAMVLFSQLKEDFETAAGCAGRLAALDRHTGYWRERRASFLLRLGRCEEAIAAYDSVLRAEPANSLHLHHRAAAYRRLKRHREAIRDYTQAADVAGRESDRAWTLYHRSTLYWIMDRREEAIADARRACSILGFASFGNARLYVMLQESGREAEARDCLAEARRSVLQEPWLGSVLSCLSGDLTPAGLVAAADPERPRQRCEACYYAGETCRLAGRADDARVWFQECINTGLRSDPENRMEPMSEYELAEWRLNTDLPGGSRLDSLGARPGAAIRDEPGTPFIRRSAPRAS